MGNIYNFLFEIYLKGVNKAFPNLFLSFILNIVIMAFIFIIMFMNMDSFDTYSLSVLIFFCLPLAQLLIISFNSHNIVKGHFTVISFIGISSYLTLWYFYNYGNFNFKNLFMVPIFFSFIFVLFSIHATFHILVNKDINKDKYPNVSNFTMVLKEERFSNIFFFLFVFLFVTYHLTFANAFHDKNMHKNEKVALYTKPDITFAKKYYNPSKNIYSPASIKPKYFVILFPDGDAQILLDDMKKDLMQLDEKSRSHITGSLFDYFSQQYSMRKDIDSEFNDSQIKRDLYEKQYIKIWNRCQLESMILHLVNTEKHREATIQVIGHSNSLDIGKQNKRFRSNSELSQARATIFPISLFNKLIDKKILLNDLPRLRFITSYVSSSDVFYHPKLKELFSGDRLSPDSISGFCASNHISAIDMGDKKHPPDLYRSIEIIISYEVDYVTQSQRDKYNPGINNGHLELFDYLYFTIYTITTTGYGDIVPISAEAKFISSIANIYELFFLVVIFNAIMSPGINSIINYVNIINKQRRLPPP
jgi:hypothetical protein